jgi:hypothetical protein
VARARAGRDPAAHVKLALWCEAHGLSAERMKHLAIAVLTDPKNATARGLMGLVDFRGRWERPEAVSAKIQSDEALAAKLAEYNARRGRMAGTADSHWNLALWCEQNGLQAEAQAHLAVVTRLDPAREAAWKRLGFKKQGGRWVTEAQLAAEKAEAEAQKKADQHWKPLLTKWRGWLQEKSKKDQADEALAGVTDPRAVPSVRAVFAGGDSALQEKAVQVLGQIEGVGASRALALLAVSGRSAEVRRIATETLKRRDSREFVGFLIGLIRDRIKYEVRPVNGPGMPGVLFVEGQRFNVQRVYAPPLLPNIPLFPGEPISYDAFGLPVVSRYLGTSARIDQVDATPLANVSLAQFLGNAPTDPATARLIEGVRSSPGNHVSPTGRPLVSIAETTIKYTPLETSVQIPVGQIMLQYQTAAAVAQQQLASDLQAVEQYNASIDESNERVVQVLRGATEHDESADRQAWAAWWTDQQGYVYKPPQPEPKPTIVQNVPVAYTPSPVVVTSHVNQSGPTTSTTTVGATNHSCFAGGTLVRTMLGPQVIESIHVGDQVLTQDPGTGRLAYAPIVAVFHNKPAPTLRIKLGEETIVATGIHRFWKVGRGWAMARDLNPGDELRVLGGVVTVSSVESDRVQPVFNLQVAEGASFLVGQQGTLVHDNSLVLPVTDPFDATSSLAAALRGTHESNGETGTLGR